MQIPDPIHSLYDPVFIPYEAGTILGTMDILVSENKMERFMLFWNVHPVLALLSLSFFRHKIVSICIAAVMVTQMRLVTVCTCLESG